MNGKIEGAMLRAFRLSREAAHEFVEKYGEWCRADERAKSMEHVYGKMMFGGIKLSEIGCVQSLAKDDADRLFEELTGEKP